MINLEKIRVVSKVCLAVVIVCLGIKGQCFAAEEVTEQNFDYNWYLEQHPDVLAAVGSEPSAVWNFYVTTGQPAGWLGRPSKEFYITSGENQESIQARLKAYEVVDSQTNSSMSNREKAKAIHDWICKNVHYQDNGMKSHTLAGAFIYGESVCDGYTGAFEFMMQLCGIPCEDIMGVANNGHDGPSAHSWNKVYIDSQWSYVDVTWDDLWEEYDPSFGIPNHITYDCFLISEERMNSIHDGMIFEFVNGEPQGYK